MRHLSVAGLAALGIAFMGVQPANAAYVFMCDNPAAEGGCQGGFVSHSEDPFVTFSLNNFEEGFQINSVTVQIGNTPATVPISENSPPARTRLMAPPRMTSQRSGTSAAQ